MSQHHDPRRALQILLATDRHFGLRELPLPRSVLSAPLGGAVRAKSPGPGGASVPRAGGGDAAGMLAALDAEQVRNCRRCKLCERRSNTVFGVGNPQARLAFVGEGPGFEEDRQGIPFVGPAGQLLTRMIAAMGLRREDVYICNVVKCRPPNNRDPEPEEILACSPYLYEQLRIVDPEVIVALGLPAARTLLNSQLSMSRLRGHFHDFLLRDASGDARTIPLMPTYHPAYLLRTPADKKKTWDDLQLVMARLGLPLPQGS